ncbi:methyltransferase domain-containing protein [Colletotrichum asianum]|uniref:Uncharacterized protein n=1 Tax=Colletotrichum asianum TaxID=702518 RepID=A0A8H3WQ99_9PEZI|nr:hypothetical protein GQ607_001909 [Colletotrichum asianum]
MSPSERRPPLESSITPSIRFDPLAARIPHQSQLARFQREDQREGNALVTLADSSRDVKSAIQYHKSRAAQAIKLFQKKFGKQPEQPSTESAQPDSKGRNSTSQEEASG